MNRLLSKLHLLAKITLFGIFFVKFFDRMFTNLLRQHFDSIDSTNTWCKCHAHELPFDQVTLVTASEQTAGRGRFNRPWKSPPNQDIIASFCFFLEEYRPDICNIPQILALNVAQILEDFLLIPQLKSNQPPMNGSDSNPSPLEVRKLSLKWPNDILLSNKKVAGILAETTPLSNRLCVILGIGLNVNASKEFLDQLDQPATSMLIESGRSYDLEEIISRLQKSFCLSLQLFLEKGFTPFLPEYRARLYVNENKKIRFKDNKQIWEGTLHAIKDDGSLCLTLPDGTRKTFIAGEVF